MLITIVESNGKEVVSALGEGICVSARNDFAY